MKTVIKKIGINGEGIGYLNRTPVFVQGALEGEEVDIEVVERFPRYAIGKLNRIYKKSEHRCDAKCRIGHRCGSCSMMISDYDYQLASKKAILKQTLIKYAHVNPKLIGNVRASASVYHYRNQFKMPCAMLDGQLINGFYAPESNYLIDVEHCMIHEKGLEKMRMKILNVLRKANYKGYSHKDKKGLRNLIVRGFKGSYQCTLVTGKEEIPQAIIDELMKIKGLVSLWQSILTTKKTTEVFGKDMIFLAGEKLLSFELGDTKLQISPRSFFQLNTAQALQLYRCVAAMIDGRKKRIVEAYSGIGCISLFLKDKAEEIIGIESIRDAVVNANMNAKNNGCEHIRFVCDDAAKRLVTLSKQGGIDVLVVDPPRSGLDDAMLKCILKSNIKEIVYISCNPATLGKNLAVLQERYEVKTVKPFDMFPQTQHVETVVKLSRKG